MRSNNKTNDNCWLCRRSFASNEGRFPVGPPIKHHIVPKQKYHNKWEDAEIILLCNRCHKQMHKMFTNNELKTMTKEELKQHEKIIDYVKWIRKD
jgi:5-methylcytosine-specific restriction endonuclease McrA